MINPYADGLKEIKEGSLYEILANIISFIGAIILLLFLFAYIISSPTTTISNLQLSSSLIGILAAVIVVIIGAILSIIGIIKLRSGFNLLKNTGLDVSIGSTGATLILISLGILIVGVVTVILVVGIFFMVIAAILELIGGIMLGLGFYNLGKGLNNSTIETAGILIIIGGIIDLLISIGGLLDFIAFILIYTSINNILSKGIPFVQTFSQMLGVIKGNGYAYLNVYSNVEGTIISARIEGTAITSTFITPNKLSIGNNSITVNFGNVQGLIPYSNYIVSLIVQDNSGRTILIPVNAQYQPY
ncbi:DUF973 family protein [Acidianus infernus]|uniref:DUF973 family protein n=1 Tax=Acidianus infernus TaxID=12915 RepID=A0A6A9QIM8_ACIIN|nr:DUF973 family protein [Acidianus infernus]MUM63758.1 DUF973 family protein [Acidianus infernus]